MSAAVASTFTESRSAQATRAPSLAKSFDVLRPIQDPAPVIRSTLSLKRAHTFEFSWNPFRNLTDLSRDLARSFGAPQRRRAGASPGDIAERWIERSASDSSIRARRSRALSRISGEWVREKTATTWARAWR